MRTQAVKRVCRDFSSILNDALTDNIIAMATEYTTIESRVAATILERTVGTLEIEGVTYNIAPPTIGTLILASEIVSYFPQIADVKDEQRIFMALFKAKDFAKLAELAAVLILGSKKQTEEREIVVVKRHLFGLIKRKHRVKQTVDLRAELAQKILDNVRPSVLFEVIIKRLRDNEIMTFFAITTSLNEANILKPTKAEVVKD
jgi:hypothetical protein